MARQQCPDPMQSETNVRILVSSHDRSANQILILQVFLRSSFNPGPFPFTTISLISIMHKSEISGPMPSHPFLLRFQKTKAAGLFTSGAFSACDSLRSDQHQWARPSFGLVLLRLRCIDELGYDLCKLTSAEI
eukprot:TRINITY_DN26744_c2_g1_i1.p1 TRINITY_DN26744_c2_g1~~TRINITY_DN26744_c2_g1_i1.p1  ORF type:complete len:133 (+),score=16.74 TRINITY_DN26744_c2_g1_i1:286-684(+)